MFESLSGVIFAAGIAGILSFVILYPATILFVSVLRRERPQQRSQGRPTVSLIIVARNPGDLLAAKVENSLSLNYPQNNLEIIVYSDGSTDGSSSIGDRYPAERAKFYASSGFEGKNAALNRAVEKAAGEILVFTDVDARLDEDALDLLVAHFSDPRVGGVCGRRVIAEDERKLVRAQRYYISLDSRIKEMESRFGSISSNDGKLYAMRKALFHPLPGSVTDDLYNCLSVVRQGYRFVFEPRALAFIRVPSRGGAHEIMRRRRIVSRSLTGIFLMRELLNPFRHGLFALGLLINKVFRRLLPVFLILFLSGSLLLAPAHLPILILLMLQTVFYGLAAMYPLILQHLPGPRFLRRLSSVAYFICLGNYGTLLGLFDFLLGRRVAKWEPIKTG